MKIQETEPKELSAVCAIINDSAQAYKGVIPEDRWHEPYMPIDALRSEVQSGVRFFGCYADEHLVGVMGIQDVKDVTLIRHAYVRTQSRGKGVGQALLKKLYETTDRPVLIGAWRAAAWAIRFYEKHGFQQVTETEKNRLLCTYWNVPPRQVEESVVLADQRWRTGTRSANAACVSL